MEESPQVLSGIEWGSCSHERSLGQDLESLYPYEIGLMTSTMLSMSMIYHLHNCRTGLEMLYEEVRDRLLSMCSIRYYSYK